MNLGMNVESYRRKAALKRKRAQGLNGKTVTAETTVQDDPLIKLAD